MKKYITIIIVFLMFITTYVDGQSQKGQEAIIALNQTAFTKKIKEFKELIEYNIRYFQENSDMLSEEEIVSVRENYIIVQEDFNIIFNELRSDFTTHKELKKIINIPDHFTRKYQSALEAAEQKYQSTCQAEIDRLVDTDSANPITGGILVITELLASVLQIVDVFKEIKTANKEMSETYFEKEYASKLRLKDWEEYESFHKFGKR